MGNLANLPTTNFATTNPGLPNLPSKLEMASKPFLARWGGFCLSRHISCANFVPPYQRRSKRLTAQQRQGLSFEKSVFAALARWDFTENLCNSLAIKSQSQIPWLILHNPHFLYSLKTKKRLCIPDILIFVPKSKQPLLNSIETNKSLDSIETNSFSILSSSILSSYLPSALFLKNKNPLSSIETNLNSIFLNNYEFIICLEIKLTYVDIAFEKLKSLYLPIIYKTFNLPVIPLVCVKNLTNFSPISTPILSKSLELKIPLLTYLGNGKIY